MQYDEYIMQAKGIFKSYRMGATMLEVLKGVDFSVRKSEFVAIVGASGSGKSSLLHILGTLDTADKGLVEFQGRELNNLKNSELNKFRNKTIGFVFQFYHLLDELNVLENVTLPAMAGVSTLGWLRCRNRAKTRGKELLQRFGLGERLKHKPYQLAGGERQRVALGRALSFRPKILCLDEPLSALDDETHAHLIGLLKRIQDETGVTALHVTHNRHEAESLADLHLRVVDGTVQVQGDPPKEKNSEENNEDSGPQIARFKQ